MRKKEELLKRYIFLLIGLLINALGVVLMTKSCLGTSPVSSIPYVLSEEFPLSLGIFTFIVYFVMFLVQVLILRRKLRISDCLQLPLTFIYSLFIDLCVSLVNNLLPSGYFMMLLIFMAGCCFRAIGVSIQVIADVAMLSSEAFMLVIARWIKKDFSIVKLLSDGIMALTAAILSIVFFGELIGIREGTLIAVLLTAPLARAFTYYIEKVIRFTDSKSSESVYSNADLPLIITISSQSGSGGHRIAKILSDSLKMPLYDNNLIDLITEEGNFAEGYVRERMERIYTNRFWEFVRRNYDYTGYSLESYEPLFETQSQLIRSIAEKGTSIIVGYCSEYILKDRENVISIYIHADEETKLQFLKKEYNVDYNEAKDIMKSHDRERALFFKHFTGEEWAVSDRFSLSVDSSLLGLEGTAELLKEAIVKMKNK